MSKKIKIIFLIIFTISLFAFSASPILAEESWVENILGQPLIPISCTQSQNFDVKQCGLNEMLQTIINFSKLILALTGSAALLMFTYGGVMFILAAGNEERAKKGIAAISAAAIGIAIVLGAWLIVNFVILALTKGEIGGEAKIFKNIPWYKEPGKQEIMPEVTSEFDFESF